MKSVWAGWLEVMGDTMTMATKQQITLRFNSEYAAASKKKGVVLDCMCDALQIGRSTARRLLTQAVHESSDTTRVEARHRRVKYSSQARRLLVCVWTLMDMPCGKNVYQMMPSWVPMLQKAGELDGYDQTTVEELLQ